MQKSKLRAYSYTILLAVSLGVAAFFWYFGGLKEQSPEDVRNFFEAAPDDFFSWLFSKDGGKPAWVESGENENTPSAGGGAGSVSGNGDTASLPKPGDVTYEMGTITISGNDNNSSADAYLNAGGVSGNTTGGYPGTGTVSGNTALGRDPAKMADPVVYHADLQYFDDALFIGDSRTVGLYEYGGLGNAEVFANSGMSIYKVFGKEFTLRNGEKTTLEEVLQNKKFGKIYIMLGINELGYDFNQTVKRYEETFAAIREWQPDALIFLMANLHITNAKSATSEYFTNENINRFNEAVSKLADGKQVFYLDVNPLYDDEEGGLSKEYTSDNAHILGKYYADWVDFILQNAVKIPEE